MKRLIVSLVRQYLFWMGFFLILRAAFLLYHIPILRSEHIRWTEALPTFWHALYLDTATTCYILLIPLLILTIQGIFGSPWLNRMNKTYAFLLIFISSLITMAELGVYGEWKTKLTSKALVHLKHPAEVYQSISAIQFFGFLFGLLALTALGFYLYKSFFYLPIIKRLRVRLWAILFLIVGAPLLIIGMRGGIGEIPITSGVSYFSNHGILNWTSVNSLHNLAVSYMEGKRYDDTNPFDFYDPDQAKNIVGDLEMVDRDTTTLILKTLRPNIVILLMESWSADLIESLGGEPGITPEFRELEKEGILFTQLYTSGNRSQQGLASILAGFPAIPYTTITENPDKYQKLPSLTKTLMEQGYHTSFFFGGDLNYGNIMAYLISNKVQEIVQEKDIDDNIPRGRLGIHDEYMMQYHAGRLGKIPEPFFSVLFTLSSHSPYDQPTAHSIEWSGSEALYVNSAYYSDYSLGRYFESVKEEPWFRNTIFLIIADHSHNSYRDWPVESFNYRKVPLLILGGALKEEWKGTRLDRISSNGDIPVTLLKQLRISPDGFEWSRDLFNPFTRQFAYFEINDGVGWKTDKGEFVYSIRDNKFHSLEMAENTSEPDQEELIRQGKSYIQVLFQTFIDL